MRYFLSLSYLGTHYAGWQRQPNAMSVQEKLETALSTLLREPIELVGCGRTDTGVHARGYVAHFDTDAPLLDTFIFKLNALLPLDIAAHHFRPVAPEAHARFDATERQYQYRIVFEKDPFQTETAWFYPQGKHLDVEKMQAVAALLPEFQAFKPFCKSDSGLENFACQLHFARWLPAPDGNGLVFEISANRFLRGMVRLIVGACVDAGRGKILPEDVRRSLEAQTPLVRAWSVPPQGLVLSRIIYGKLPH